MHALGRRIVFSILISSTDDHLRNHGFLWEGPSSGWRLSPAYDLNPVPADMKPRVLTTAIDLDNGTASLKLALEAASYFELGEGEAHKIAGQVGHAVATWRKQAAKLGPTLAEIDRMASAFEHEDLHAALALCSRARRIKQSLFGAHLVNAAPYLHSPEVTLRRDFAGPLTHVSIRCIMSIRSKERRPYGRIQIPQP